MHVTVKEQEKCYEKIQRNDNNMWGLGEWMVKILQDLILEIDPEGSSEVYQEGYRIHSAK